VQESMPDVQFSCASRLVFLDRDSHHQI